VQDIFGWTLSQLQASNEGGSLPHGLLPGPAEIHDNRVTGLGIQDIAESIRCFGNPIAQGSTR